MQVNYLRIREFALREFERLRQRPESGQGMVEYALLLVLIAIVLIVILSTLGKTVNNVFSNISTHSKADRHRTDQAPESTKVRTPQSSPGFPGRFKPSNWSSLREP